MPHLRSKEALKKRSIRSLARRFVLAMSFRDRQLAESISRTGKDEAIKHIRPQIEETLEELPVELRSAKFKNLIAQVPDVEKGLVLSDSRGRGAFQT